ncbi:choice-of-anchor D domain-containing protein [Myxococcota bacterium]|nr:choice-of-anchor D domain-containing protein [Myxococcota bacterium]
MHATPRDLRSSNPPRALVALALLVVAGCAEEQLGVVRPDIEVSPSAIELGATPIGVRATHEVTVTNGGAGALTIASIALVMEAGVPSSADLSISTVALPAKLGASQSLTFDVVHLPTDDVLDAAILRVTSDDPLEPEVDVPIGQTAEGMPRVAAVPDLPEADREADASGVTTTIDAITLGTVPLGASKTAELWIVNAGAGNLPLRVTDVSIQGAATEGLRVTVDPDPSAGRVLLPRLGSASRAADPRSLHVTITYTPVTRGAVLDAGLRVSSNDASRRELELPITGDTTNADPPAMRLVPPAGLVFSGVAIGERREATLTVHNDGGSDLTLDPLVLGTNPGGAFELVEPPAPATITPGTSRVFTIAFTPAAAQVYTGVLELVANDPARANPIVYPLTGEVGEEPMTCTPTTPDPGEPANDACASATDRGAISLPTNMTQRRSWNDAMLHPASDGDWSHLTLTVQAGCFLVGYDLGATVTLPAGEQAEVCVQAGDCASPADMACGMGRARLLLFPADTLCESFANTLPIRVRVRHTGGEPMCLPYTVDFDAR